VQSFLRQFDNEVGGVLSILRDCHIVHRKIGIVDSGAELVALVAIAAKDFGVSVQVLEALSFARCAENAPISVAASIGARVESLINSEARVSEDSDSNDYARDQ
jgi:hypothetical protein